jgi:hypothetical protein
VRANCGIPIELSVWKDPQGYVLVEQTRDEAWLYFSCWSSAGVTADHVGCLHFEGVWHLSSTRFKNIRSYPDIAESDLRSYYLAVADSSLLKKLETDRSAEDTDWRRYDQKQYTHWVVESHDYYTNVVASQVSFQQVTGQQAQKCFDVWNRV